MNEEEKLKMYLTILNDENPSHVKENAKTNIIILFDKQQKEIEKRLKEIDSLYKMVSTKDDEIEYLADKIEQMEEDYISKDKIKEIISKYVDIEEHLVYHHQELWGTDLAEMIKELLGDKI